jgi:hypothetical protein
VLGENVGLVAVSAMANFTVARNGTIVFGSLADPKRMAWRDGGGKQLAELAPPDDAVWPRRSPDGTRVAITRYTIGFEYSAIIYDVAAKCRSVRAKAAFRSGWTMARLSTTEAIFC